MNGVCSFIQYVLVHFFNVFSHCPRFLCLSMSTIGKDPFLNYLHPSEHALSLLEYSCISSTISTVQYTLFSCTNESGLTPLSQILDL